MISLGSSATAGAYRGSPIAADADSRPPQIAPAAGRLTSREVIIGLGDVYVQIPHRQVAEGLMAEAGRHALVEDGCRSFTFAEVLEEPGHFVVLERWSDEQAIERHYRSAAFADYQRTIARLLVRESEYRLYRVQETSHPVDSVRIVTDQDD